MAIARFSLVALDCPNPRALAEFYQSIVGGTIDEKRASPEWVRLHTSTGTDLGFQLDLAYVAPQWPDGSPQQMHIDVDVSNLDTAESEVLALGARKALTQPSPDEWRVFLDPAGHPFCLVLVV